MIKTKFKSLLAQVDELSRTQIAKLTKALESRGRALDSAKALTAYEPTVCPHCGCGELARNGVQNGLQRFICKGCRKTCCAATATPLAGLKNKALLAGYAECLSAGLTIRETSAKLGMSVERAFRWRHRMLQMPVEHQPRPVQGLLEIDETYFQRSEKGSRGLTRPARGHGGMTSGSGRLASEWVPVLVGRVRGQAYTFDKVLERMDKTTVAAALKPSIDSEATMLCSDAHKTFLAMEKELNVACQFFVESEKRHKGLHVNNVNNYHERLKTWINCGLRGVATKYLPHYLAWQRLRTWGGGPISASDIIGSSLGHQIINV